MKKAYRTTKFGIVSSRLYRDERDPAFELPEVTPEDAGKVLVVDEDGKWTKGDAEALPEVTTADAGKVLTVSDAGAWEAAAASGGGIPVFDFAINAGATTCRITPDTGVTVSGILEALSDGLAVAKLRAGSSKIKYLFISRSETTQEVMIFGYNYTMNVNGVLYNYYVDFDGIYNGTTDNWSGQIIGRIELQKP